MAESPRPRRPGLWLDVEPQPGGERRSLHLSWSQVRILSRLLTFGGGLVLLLLSSWWFVAGGYQTTAGLPNRVTALEEERAKVVALSRQLEEVEALYAQVWTMLGGDRPSSGVFWTPPPPFVPDESPIAAGAGVDPEGLAPSGWPLTERGFLSQPLSMTGDQPDQAHSGIDLAIPSGSYLLAVGQGEVVARGEDPVYGLYLVLQHPGGWESRYAHASVVTVEVGDRVREGDVLGLTGSSGRSSAPHLHFELLYLGVPVDPLLHLTRP
jgi:murein DD-endopeptidase MepM/ murein hydrolase activator NlpD